MSKEEAKELYGADDLMTESDFVEYMQEKEISLLYRYKGISRMSQKDANFYDNSKIVEIFKNKL